MTLDFNNILQYKIVMNLQDRDNIKHRLIFQLNVRVLSKQYCRAYSYAKMLIVSLTSYFVTPFFSWLVRSILINRN